MTETEIVLQLTIKALENVDLSLDACSPSDAGLAVCEIYNTIRKNINLYNVED